MKILAIESSAGPASCAVWEDGRLLAASAVYTGLTHSQTLLPMTADMLRNAGLTMDDVDLLAVAAGPGSFTGVRIGVAAVKGLAFAKDKPCCGVSTLAAMARLTEGLPFTGTVCAVMDARCRQVYTARFACRDGALERLSPDEALPLEVLRDALAAESAKPVLLVGDGAAFCYDALAGELPFLRPAPEGLRLQHARGVAAEAAAHPETAVPGDRLVPRYLRLPQAERELRRKQGLPSGG